MPSCYQTRIIEAPVEKVWEAIKCFHDLSWAPNVVTSCEKVGPLNGDTVGAKRILNEVFEETLLSVDADKHTFSYSIDEAPSPVSSSEISNYVGEVRLLRVTQTDQTFIEWKSSWRSKSLDGEEFCHMIYVALMADLNTSMLKKGK